MDTNTPLLQIDGSFGEGGGQILRSSLALSMITGRAFRIFNIRANRPKPGLRRQHMTAVLAAAAVCSAQVSGATVDSREVTFIPGAIQGGNYFFDVGSAGSTMLVLQTILPALMTTQSPSTIMLVGGTHNFGAPPLPFLEKTFLPMIARMGPRVKLELERAGFAPRGGGRARVEIAPATLKQIKLNDRGQIVRKLAKATLAALPRDIAQRELQLAARLLALKENQLAVEELPADQGPGNLFTAEIETQALTTVFTAFGGKGIRAEDVARDACRQTTRFLDRDVPVDEHLADQLLLPMALAGGGECVTTELSLHATTNIQTIKQFIEIRINVREESKHQYRVHVGQ
jgi:RNA 3'-terminal phosphate cyclase (ATP)